VYAAPMYNGDIAAVIVNWRELAWNSFSFNLADIGAVGGPGQVIKVRDLWEHKSLGDYTPGLFTAESIPGHGNKAIRVSVESK